MIMNVRENKISTMEIYTKIVEIDKKVRQEHKDDLPKNVRIHFHHYRLQGC